MKVFFYLLFLVSFLSCSRTAIPDYNIATIENNLVPAVEFEGDTWQQLNVQDRMERYGVSAFSVALLGDGEIIWTKAYGVYSNNDKRQISTNTLFQAASLSKPITALGVMTLVDEGILKLENPANDYLKIWKLPKSKLSVKPVQISGLLSHTAGISVPSYPGYEAGEERPSINEILDGKMPSKSAPVRVITAPGRHAYSGGGYMVLQKIIEDQTGKPLNTFMDDTLFSPLGLKHTTFNIIKPVEDQGHKNIALGHNWVGDPYENGWQMYPQQAAAALWSTPNELATILKSYIAAYNGQKNDLFSAKTARLMAKNIDGNMGLGFGVHGEGVGKHIDHAGWTRGYRSYLVVFPETGDGVVLMANGNNGDRLIQEMTRAIAKELKWPAYQPEKLRHENWTPEQLHALVGDYKMMPARFTISIVAEGDHLIISTPRGTSYTAYPISNTELVTIEDGEHIIISRSKNIELSMWGMKAIRQK